MNNFLVSSTGEQIESFITLLIDGKNISSIDSNRLKLLIRQACMAFVFKRDSLKPNDKAHLNLFINSLSFDELTSDKIFTEEQKEQFSQLYLRTLPKWDDQDLVMEDINPSSRSEHALLTTIITQPLIRMSDIFKWE